MVKTKDIDKLLSRKKLKGNQLGRLLLLTLLDQVNQRPERIPVAEINELLDRLANAYERDVYDSYVRLYAELVDVFNAMQSEAVNANLGLTNVKMNLTLLGRSVIAQKSKHEEPILITKNQYKAYEDKYQKFLKEKAKENEGKKISLQDYLDSSIEADLDEILENEDADLDEYKKKYPHFMALLAKYAKELVPERWTSPLRKIYRKSMESWNAEYADPVEILKEFTDYSNISTFELIYGDALSNYDGTPKEIFSSLIALYNKAKYSLNLNDQDTLKYISKESGIDLAEVYNKSCLKQDPHLPDKLTMKDIIVHEVASCTTSNDKDQKLLKQFTIEELIPAYKALIDDLILQYPKMKKLLSFDDPDDLFDRKLSTLDLAEAGDPFCKEDITPTSLQANGDSAYDICNVFPETQRRQVLRHGFAVYHGSGMQGRTTEELMEENGNFNYQSLSMEFDQLCDASDSIKQGYQASEAYLRDYQAYSAFINGIVAFTHCTEFDGFKNLPEHQGVLNQIDSISALRDLTLSQLHSFLSPEEFEKKAQKIKETYSIPDPEKSRIKNSTKSALGSYVAKTFSSTSEPIITSVLLKAIREGVDDDE